MLYTEGVETLGEKTLESYKTPERLYTNSLTEMVSTKWHFL